MDCIGLHFERASLDDAEKLGLAGVRILTAIDFPELKIIPTKMDLALWVATEILSKKTQTSS